MSDTSELPSMRVEAESESATKTSVTARDFQLTVDEPESMGGSDDGPNPLEYLIAGQAGCLNVTGHQVAEEMGIELDDLAITIEGEFDPAKFQGEDMDERAGYQGLRVTIEADTDADREPLERWIEQVEERCPVTDNVENATPIDVSISAK
ncbi:OsmC family protein [Halalkalicoccus ordinarius]|uniref:OsmC family protein n=1 Tax=Halalkalicoccus ordinarius TaxID=3116651 RepID=UPI00300F0E10